MSAIKNTAITLGGLSALAYTKAHQRPLVFTRMKIGDGFNTGKLEEQSSLVNMKLDLPLTNIEQKDNDVYWIEATMSNNDLTEGFYYREIGLFCQNPENSAEDLLYCYGNAGELAEFVVADNSTTAVLKTIRLILSVSNEQHVTINMNDENHATNNYVNTSIKNAISTHTTNCILEIPQDIKLDITDGVLTVYAGSKVTVPYGTAAPTLKIGDSLVNDNFKIVNISYENSKLFYQVEIQNDITDSYVINDTNTRLIEIDLSTGNDVQATIYTKSGTDASNFSGVFYNYEKNTLASYVSGSTSNNVLSLPIAKTTADGVNLYGSLDQVFNGVSYCGGSLFALPGLTGLIPNGRNADGTLNNKIVTVPEVRYITLNSNFSDPYTPLVINAEGYPAYWDSKTYYQEETPPATAWSRWYKPSLNIWFETTTNSVWSLAGDNAGFLIGTGAVTNGIITSITSQLPFRAADKQDVVGRTGPQTMGGSLTIETNETNKGFYIQDSNLKYDETPTTDREARFYLRGKDGVVVGGVFIHKTTEGEQRVSLYARNKDVQSSMGFSILEDGTVKTHVPTPAADDDSFSIANTEWTNDKFLTLMDEKDFEIESLGKMIELDLTKLFIQIFEDTSTIDKTKGDGAYCITNYYDAAKRIFVKNDTTTRVIYSIAKTVTTGNNKVWCAVDWTNISSGTVKLEISRNGGTNWTTLTEDSLTDISTQPAGSSMVLRVTVTGSLRLKNIAWGMKA